MSRSSWMHLDLDAFFASVEQKLQPELKGKPILVGRVDPHGRSVPRGVVATASYEARKFGAKSGMPLYQALRICPTCIVVGGHYEEYIASSDAVFSICARYSPKVEQISLDEAFLDFSGTEIIYPKLTYIAKKIKEEVKNEVGITASIGIAATKVVAKVASDYQKPDGLTYVPVGNEKEFLAPLSLQTLPGINEKTKHRLTTLLSINIVNNKNEFSVGDFAKLPQNLVEEKTGKWGLSLWRAANGIDNMWFTHKVQSKSVSRSETFYKNSADEKFVLEMLQHLTERVGEEIRHEGYSGRCVHVTICYRDFRKVSRQRVLPYPTSSTKEIFEMGKELLLELWDARTPLRLIGIGVTGFGETVQGSLFDSVRDKRLELEKRIDILRERFGKKAIIPASLMKLNKVKET